MSVRRGVIIALLSAVAFPAFAGEVTVSVRTPSGAPVENAVVTLSGPGKTQVSADALKIDQKDLQFHPFVLIAPRGASVSFPNLDQTRHHVYSFSPTGPFELKLYGRGEAPSVKFDKPGTIAIGCNIHDGMNAFIRVTDAPYAAVTNAKGEAVIRDIDAGAHTLEVWHPLQKGGTDTVASRVIQISGTSSVSQVIELSVRKPLVDHSHY